MFYSCIYIIVHVLLTMKHHHTIKVSNTLKQCVPFIAIMSNDFELLIKCTNVFFQSFQSCKKYKTCFFECKSCNLHHCDL